MYRPTRKITPKLVRSKNIYQQLQNNGYVQRKDAALVFILICKTDSLRLTISLNICFVKLQSSALHISGMVAEGCRARPYSCGAIYAPIFRTILDSRSPTFEKYIVRSIVFGATYLLTTFKMARQRFLFINCLYINKPSPEFI